MRSSNLAGSFSGKGKVTQVDKYGNVTCETVCVVLKVSKTCDKGKVYLINAKVGDDEYNSLIVKYDNDNSSLWYGQGEGALLHINFNTDDDDCDDHHYHHNHHHNDHHHGNSVDFRFSSYTSGNFENWSAGEFKLKACKCHKQDKCGCDCERH